MQEIGGPIGSVEGDERYNSLIELLLDPNVVVGTPHMAIVPHLPCLGSNMKYGKAHYNLLNGKANYADFICSNKEKSSGNEGEYWRIADYDNVVLAIDRADQVCFKDNEDWSGNIFRKLLIGFLGRKIAFERELNIQHGSNTVETVQTIRERSKEAGDRFYFLNLVGRNIRRKEVDQMRDRIEYSGMWITLCIRGKNNATEVTSCIESMIEDGKWSELFEAFLRRRLLNEFPKINNMTREKLLEGVEGIRDGEKLELKVLRNT